MIDEQMPDEQATDEQAATPQPEGRVIIVDDEGNRHIFPHGFDPQEAAKIVRKATGKEVPPTRFASAKTGGSVPGTTEQAMQGSGWEFLTGVGNGILTAIDPRTYIQMASDALTQSPLTTATDLAKAPIRLAGGLIAHPAETAGELTGGAITAHAVPMGAKPAANVAGNVMEQVAKKGGWPIRMMGAHQLGSGNPLGAAVIAIPDALEAAGSRLKKYGTPDEATLRRISLQQELESAPPTAPTENYVRQPASEQRAPAAVRSELSEKAATPVAEPAIPQSLPELNTAIESDLRAGGSARVSKMKALRAELDRADRAVAKARTAEEKAAANAARLKLINEGKAALEANPATYSETVTATGPGGEKLTKRQTYRNTEETGAGTSLSPDEQRLLDQLEALNASRRAGEGKPATPASVPGQSTAESVRASFRNPPAETSTPAPVRPPIRIAPEGTPGERIPTGAATTPGKIPVDVLRKNLSHEAPSPTPGLTMNDYEALETALNTKIPTGTVLKSITPEMERIIMDARESRYKFYLQNGRPKG